MFELKCVFFMGEGGVWLNIVPLQGWATDPYLGPDYMSQAGPVSQAALVWAGPVVMLSRS